MKLTKEEIKFIDNYLIKNEVKFWDVRLELLDHIVSAVEDKIKNEGISFNEALLDVHRGFGNQLVKGSIPQKEIWTKGLYQSNIGFKKFVNQTQKQLGKKNRKQYWITLKKTLYSSKFWIEYACLICIVFFAYQYSPKTAFLVSLIAIALPELYKFKYVFRKGIRKSLIANTVGLLNSSFLCLQGLILQLYNEAFTVGGITDHFYIICFYLLVFPFIRSSLNQYMRTLNSVLKRYKLLII